MLSGKHTYYCLEKDVSAGKEDTNMIIFVHFGFSLSLRAQRLPDPTSFPCL